MTIEQIYGEVMQDYKTLSRKSHSQGFQFQQEMKRKRLSHEVRVITYKTPSFNNWNIMFSIYTDMIKNLYYLRSCDKRGTVTYSMEFMEDGEKQLIKINTHFFKRYNERLHLGMTQPGEVVKHFFKYNMENDKGQSQVLQNGKRLVEFVYPTGIGIGWQDDDKKVIHIKTFIANETLNKSQKNLAEFIKDHDDSEEFESVISLQHLRDDV